MKMNQIDIAVTEIQHVLGSTLAPWQRKALETALDALRNEPNVTVPYVEEGYWNQAGTVYTFW